MYDFSAVLVQDWRIFGQPAWDELVVNRDLVPIREVLVRDPLDFGQPADPWMVSDEMMF